MHHQVLVDVVHGDGVAHVRGQVAFGDGRLVLQRAAEEALLEGRLRDRR
jgi:hypothetical protein